MVVILLESSTSVRLVQSLNTLVPICVTLSGSVTSLIYTLLWNEYGFKPFTPSGTVKAVSVLPSGYAQR